MRISAERYVKSIAELRRKIFLTKQNLEGEIEVNIMNTFCRLPESLIRSRLHAAQEKVREKHDQHEKGNIEAEKNDANEANSFGRHHQQQ